MRKQIGTGGFLVASFGLTCVAIISLFTALQISWIPILILLVALIFGVVALVRSIKERSAGKIVLGVVASIFPILVFAWLMSVYNLASEQAASDARRILDEYGLSAPTQGE